ncbi:unnamed protein product [Miscanthus lutarioriparius]|uniref:Chloroplast protein HCF243 n=1 Tax=Miscanthus lutarioriparius TaxID=422564 RepID=A0A811SJ24_9POAL|nr:unnamed protein product [Miscanthus lutarioriparius]
MRRKKHLDRGGGGGGGGGTELFICFTSRPSAASAASVAGGSAQSSLRPSSSSKLLSPGRGSASASGAEAVPAPPLHPSLSRRLRNSGSLKGGQSPMFPSGSTGGGRRGRGGFEPAEPSSPKVTCIGQVRVKGGKRKPKHASAAALRSRSRRGGVGGGGSAEVSFRRSGDDRDGPQGKNQGWVYQIPVNICEALKTFGSCGGRSLCSPSRPGGAGERGALSADAHRGKKRRQGAPAGGSWLCGAAVARCLLAIQEEEEDEVGKGAAVVPAEEMRASEVGLVMEGWDVEEEKAVMVGEVEVEKKDEILVVGKEEEGRVSVCIPPRNALLLMRCRSDPVRMAALATRFWGSPAAATVEQVDNEVAECLNDNEEEEEEEEAAEAEAEAEPVECKDEVRSSAVSVKDLKCEECGCDENDGAEAGKIDQAKTEAEESSKCGDLVEEKEDASCRVVGVEEAQIVRKDAGLEVPLGEVTEREKQGPDMVELVASEEEVPAQEIVEEEMKGRRSISSYSPSAALKEDRTKLRRLSSRRRVSTSSRASSSSDKVGRRHSFSAETEARRSNFSSLKDSRRASFSIDRDGRRWSFSIEQEHLVAEPKVLMASRKGKKTSSEAESEKDCDVAPNSAEEGQESYDDGKEEETTENVEEEGKTQYEETNQEVEKVETRAEECEGGAGPVIQRRKKSGELPDCLLLMMYEPKLSMEVSKETWVCSTDFVHWKSYQGKNNRNHRQQKASVTGTVEPEKKENAEGTTIVNDVQESKDPSTVNSAVPMPCPVTQKTPPLKPATTEQKLKLEVLPVTNAAAYAPFVLKRCKSEPMRSSARLAPDACFWKDRHRPLNATGVGF